MECFLVGRSSNKSPNGNRDFQKSLSKLQPTPRIEGTTEFLPGENDGSNLRIIAIGCNRVDGLLRTLNSVKESDVPVGATLHICVDGCGIQEVASVARDFHWPFGEKILTIREEPFGLAKHITHCWENPQKDQWALFLEDDVIIDRFAFSAFSEAVQIREKHGHSSKIVSIALHDVRVNQYCWRDRIKKKPCPSIHELCQTDSDTWSTSGALLCLKDESPGSWLLYQTPSSWGALYEGEAWSTYQSYFKLQMDLAVGSSLQLAIPHSFSNEWEFSWKRFFLELMYRYGWTSMYRADLQQKGFAMTFRDIGIHSLGDPKQLKYENQKKCLQSVPLVNESSFQFDTVLSSNGTLLKSFDYCSFETSLEKLNQQAAVATNVLFRQSKIEATQQFASNIKAMHEKYNHVEQNDDSDVMLSSGYDITFLEQAEIMIVTSFGSKGNDFVRAANHFESFDGSVHFLVIGSKGVCSKIMRGNIYGTCVDEIQFASQKEGGNHLPVLSKLLKAAVDFSGPNIKWIGYMNGDILLDNSISKLLPSILSSEVCKENDFRCVATGQRYDINEVTNEENLHSEYGMDYFLFTAAGVDYLLQDNRLPPFKIGLIRWDSWLMAFLSSSDEIHVIDLSKVLKVKHYMKSEASFQSKTNTDLWNLKLADRYTPPGSWRMGKTDFSNYRMDEVTGALEPLMSATALQKKSSANRLQWTFDGELEKISNYAYTSGALPFGKYLCLCGLLAAISQSGNDKKDFPIEQLLVKQCSQPGFIENSRKMGFGGKILFGSEFFSMVSGQEMNDLQLFIMNSNLFSDNASKCCMLTQASEPSKVIPAKFWVFDDKDKNYNCLIGQF